MAFLCAFVYITYDIHHRYSRINYSVDGAGLEIDAMEMVLLYMYIRQSYSGTRRALSFRGVFGIGEIL